MQYKRISSLQSTLGVIGFLAAAHLSLGLLGINKNNTAKFTQPLSQ
jgi:hypothetical protein